MLDVVKTEMTIAKKNKLGKVGNLMWVQVTNAADLCHFYNTFIHLTIKYYFICYRENYTLKEERRKSKCGRKL